MVTRNLWSHGTINQSRPHATVTGEVDLRLEFDKLVYGDPESGAPPHGHWVLIRHARRDASNIPLPCTCTSGHVYTDADPTCVYCDGEGFYWDEKWYWVYSQMTGDMSSAIKYLPFGAVKVDYHTFYLRFDTPILHGDKIIEVCLDIEGNPLIPYVRRTIYTPSTIQEYRADNGRIEYIAAHCREEDAIRPENPVTNVRK